MTTLSIIGGRVVDPAAHLDLITDLHIATGKIIAVGKPPSDFKAERQIDAQQKIVCPGLVDLSVRLREPGAEHKGTIITETRAAASSGITTVCCPPDTNPVIDIPAVAELLQQRAAHSGMAKVLPLAALTRGLAGEQLAEMGDLKEAGCVAVSNVLPIVNTEVLRYALEYAANCELTVFIHPREPWLGVHGCAHEGAVSTRLGLSGIPETTETIEVARHLLLIEATGVRAHFCRLSTARAVEMVKHAQTQGLHVTADVSAHHLFLTEMDINNYNSQCHVYPPLRTQQDKAALRTGLLQGGIDAICSDHQPHEADAKLSPFAMTAMGISGLDTLLPLCLHLAEEMSMDLITLLSYVTSKPAQILGIDAGTLAVGQAADICIFDPNDSWQLAPENMHSKGLNSPFLGWEFKGRVIYTLINGKVVYTLCE
ncbi:dihydroorotase [Thioploca ingrica]|uniref:Dihydroorotase n=1 Tax=Thioploca ingrica TaxID=40754 RepID=A0A090ABG4_9GAMM|nr:dihydroorotase [Thioploca ingrica]